MQKIKFLAPSLKRTPIPRSSNAYSAHYIYKNCLVAVTRSSSSGWRPVIEFRSMQYAASNAVPLFRPADKCVSYRLYPGIRSELSLTASCEKWLSVVSLHNNFPTSFFGTELLMFSITILHLIDTFIGHGIAYLVY